MEQLYTHKTNQILKQTSTWTINHKPFSLLVRPQTKLDFLNIFIIQNKGKGPPGRMRSPGLAFCPTRDNQPAAFKWPLPELVEGKNQIKNELQTHIKTKFLSQLNFTIMKKQILFLAFFVLAALVSVTNTYGQATHHSLPRALDPATCQDDALHPLAGIPYDYGVGVSPTGGTYQWIVTDQPNFMTNGALTSDVLTVTTDELMAFSNATSETSTITWTSKILEGRVENPATLFVGVKYDVTAPCTTNNFKVYPIVPFKAFTVDLLSLDPVSVTATVTYGGTTTQCYDVVQSATYNPTANVVDYNFGKNILYYEMVAANFVGNYMPSFQLSGLSGTQSATVEWDYTTAFSAPVDLGTQDGTGTLTFAGTTSATTTEPSTGQGVSIFVRVTISNNSWEGIADNSITLAANGVNTDGENDIPNDATDTYNTCAGTATYDDIATQVLSARPDVTTALPTPGLIPNGN